MNQFALVQAYSVAASREPAASRELLGAAREYNRWLLAGKPGPALGPQAEYREMLLTEGSEVMARLRIPPLGVDLPVFHGTDEAVLLRGAGHLEGTFLPVGGDSSHTVLTAHSGMATATMFTNLRKLQEGDHFSIEVLGETLTYRVRDITVVRPDQTGILLPEPGRDLATLITCTPPGINTERLIVTGERVTPAGPDPRPARPGPGFPWWLVALAVGASLIAVTTRNLGASPPGPRHRGRPIPAPAPRQWNALEDRMRPPPPDESDSHRAH